VNPDRGPETTGLWLAIQQAYESGDLEGLRALAVLAELHGSAPAPLEGLAALEARRRDLEERTRALATRIAKIRGEWPFTVLPCIRDPQWAEEQRNAFREQKAAERLRRADLAQALWEVEREARNGC